MSKEIPETIGKYRILGELGRGAMGVVYKGFDDTIDRQVAVKVLHAHILQNDDFVDIGERFQQEAKAAARVMHQNIVTVFDYGFETGSSYLVMEFVEGDNLKKRIANNEIESVAQAIDIAAQILSALSLAHENGVVHRDIKPENIILLASGQVKVSDFGVARLDTSDLTSAGMMVGTPKYMSPEGLRGKKVDGRSDIYSTGLVLLEMITKLKLHPGMSVDEMIEELLRFTATTEIDLMLLSESVKRALAKNRADRYQKAGDFAEDLRAIMNQHRASLTYLGTVAGSGPTSQGGGSKSASSAASQWDPAILKEIEMSLAKYIGPLAHRLVKRNSRNHSDILRLSESLGAHIPIEAERSQFIDGIKSTGFYKAYDSQISAASQSTSRSSSIFASQSSADTPTVFGGDFMPTPQMLEQISSELAYHVGPLASRLVKRAAKKAVDGQLFVDTLASNVGEKSDREAFIKKARAALGL